MEFTEDNVVAGPWNLGYPPKNKYIIGSWVVYPIKGNNSVHAKCLAYVYNMGTIEGYYIIHCFNGKEEGIETINGKMLDYRPEYYTVLNLDAEIDI